MTGHTIACGYDGCDHELPPHLSQWFLHLQGAHRLTLEECIELFRSDLRDTQNGHAYTPRATTKSPSRSSQFQHRG